MFAQHFAKWLDLAEKRFEIYISWYLYYLINVCEIIELFLNFKLVGYNNF